MAEQCISISRFRELSGIPPELILLLIEGAHLPILLDKSGTLQVRLVPDLAYQVRQALMKVLQACECPPPSQSLHPDAGSAALSTIAAAKVSEGLEQILDMAFQELQRRYPAGNQAPTSEACDATKATENKGSERPRATVAPGSKRAVNSKERSSKERAGQNS